MAHFALTGARGFIGWHTRVAASVEGLASVPVAVGDSYKAEDATSAVSGSDRLIHIAGVNRGTDAEIHDGNILFARQAAAAVRAAENPPPVIVFANSTQVGNGSIYARAKEDAAEILAVAAANSGSTFVDLQLPNIFGEHGRPFYNSVVSTFCHLVATGGAPTIDVDRELTLLHAQDAADLLLGTADLAQAPVARVTVTALLGDIQRIAALLSSGVLPDFDSAYERNLVNTYRSFVSTEQQRAVVPAVPGQARMDGETSLHRRVFERVAAAQGTATVTLRRPFTAEVVELPLNGDRAVDLPTLWSASVAGSADLELRTWRATEAS